MGYYTTHNLTVVKGDGSLIEKFREDCESARYAIDIDGYCSDSCKWYSHEEDMRAFSKKHPLTLFLLEGEGEEVGDIWKEYYKGGMMQRCPVEMTFPPYDKNKLS